VGFRALKFHALGMDGTPCAAPADSDNPRKAKVHQWRWLRLIGKQPQKLHGTLIAAFFNFYFFRAGELLVARHALQSVAKRTCIESRDGNGVVTLNAFFGSEFESDTGITADFIYRAVKRKHFFRGDQG